MPGEQRISVIHDAIDVSRETGPSKAPTTLLIGVQLSLILFVNGALLYLSLTGESAARTIVFLAVLIPVALFSAASGYSALQGRKGLQPLRILENVVVIGGDGKQAGRERRIRTVPGHEVREFRIRLGGPRDEPYSLDIVLKSGKVIRTGHRQPSVMRAIIREFSQAWPEKVFFHGSTKRDRED